MYNPEQFSIISLEVGVPSKYTSGIIGNGSMELSIAQKFARTAGDSRFSPSAFAQYLYECASTIEEDDKILLSMLYYVQAAAKNEEHAHAYICRRIMDALGNYGYLDVAFEGEV